VIPLAPLQSFIARFPACRVGIVGDIMVDRFIYGDAQRISPEAPVPVVAVRRRTTQPGGAGNVAANVVSLGGQASLFGYVGHDNPGSEVTQLLRTAGVDVGGVLAQESCCTTVKTRVVARSQHMLRIDEETRDGIDSAAPAALIHALSRALDALDVVAISDYNKGVINGTVAQAVIGLCRDAGKPVIVDPKPASIRFYSGAALIKPNMGEARSIAGMQFDGDDALLIARRVAEISGAAAVIITAGADGMYVLDGDELTHLPGHPRDVYDVAGAGDSTLAAVALGLAAGARLLEAAALGNLAGSRAVGHLGVAAITAEELLEELQGYGAAV
jgi:rfaE bifunctional protein kinase chain/domain